MTASAPQDTPVKPGVRLLVIILVVVVGTNFAISAIIAPSVAGWYAGLEKPALTPPGPAFGIVWPTLYVLISLALWLYLRAGGGARGFTLWLVQLIANGVWPLAFFGLQNVENGFYGAVVLSLAVAALIPPFWRASRAAGLMLLPYLAWTLFAVYLSYGVLRLNG